MVTFPLVALAKAFTAWPPQPLTALAPASQLLTGGIVAGTLVVATACPPSRLADAPSSILLTLRVGAAVAGVGALWTPPAWITSAFSIVLVTFAILAQAGLLAIYSPAVWVASALPDYVIALAIWVACTFFLAVRSPKLLRTFGLTVGSKVSMAAAALVGSYTDFILFACKVALA